VSGKDLPLDINVSGKDLPSKIDILQDAELQMKES
jgi:hypothetical protein